MNIQKLQIETIDTSSIIKARSSHKLFLKADIFLSFSLGKFFPYLPTGIPNEVWIVVPSILTAATPVGATSNTFGLSKCHCMIRKDLC